MKPIYSWISGMVFGVAGIALIVVGALTNNDALLGVGIGLLPSAPAAVLLPSVTKKAE